MFGTSRLAEKGTDKTLKSLSQYVFLMEAVITKKIPCCIKYEVFLQE
jgi:hypothetical protein